MTRNAAVARLRFLLNEDDPGKLTDLLQLRGLVADEAVRPKDCATCDLMVAVEKLTE